MGFLDGFTDFVYAGGSGEPPPVPPRQFWNVEWRSPRGHEASQDWFSGYRHGARVARDGGFRQRAIVQSSVSWMGIHPALFSGAEEITPLEDLGLAPLPDPDTDQAAEELNAPHEAVDSTSESKASDASEGETRSEGATPIIEENSPPTTSIQELDQRTQLPAAFQVVQPKSADGNSAERSSPRNPFEAPQATSDSESPSARSRSTVNFFD
jgi:hypothetical protein